MPQSCNNKSNSSSNKFKDEKVKRIQYQQWYDHVVAKLRQPWYLVNTADRTTSSNARQNHPAPAPAPNAKGDVGASRAVAEATSVDDKTVKLKIISSSCQEEEEEPPVDTRIYCNQPKLPDGVFYVRNFLSVQEEHTLMEMIDGTDDDDSNQWSNVIARRQQFWGDVYYHTKHDLPAVQPDFLATTNFSNNSYTATTNNDVIINKNTKKSERNYNIPNPPSLDISSMNWLLQKIETIGDRYTNVSNGGFFEYQNNVMAYYPTPPGIFTATKDTSPLVISSIISGDTPTKTQNSTKQTTNFKCCCSNKNDKETTSRTNSNRAGCCGCCKTTAVENPTQVLVNEYIGTMGIFSHIDDPYAFGQVLVMISLNDPIIMRLSKTPRKINNVVEFIQQQNNDIALPSNFIIEHSINDTNSSKNPIQHHSSDSSGNDVTYVDSSGDSTSDNEVCILLEPRSLLVLKGQARFEYEHSITKHKWVAVNHIHVTCSNDYVDNCCHLNISSEDELLLQQRLVNNTFNDLSYEDWMKLVSSDGRSFQTVHLKESNNGSATPSSKLVKNKKYQSDLFIYERKEKEYRRLSLTIRHLLDGRKRIPHSASSSES